MGENGVISERNVHSLHWKTWKGRGSAYQLTGKIIYKELEGQRVCQSQSLCWARGWKSWIKHRGDAPSERPVESKEVTGSFSPCRNSQHQLFLFQYNYLIRGKNTSPFPWNKVIKSAVSMTMRQPYTCPIHNIFPRSVWTSVIQSQCFHETKNCFSCYRCILQTTERKAPGISKAVDSAEPPQFNLWSETADRLQTQFYFTVTKAMNLVLCHLNQWWLMSFKTFKSAKGSSSERKGFTWHRKRQDLVAQWHEPGILQLWGRTGVRVTVSNDITIWNISLSSYSSCWELVLSF